MSDMQPIGLRYFVKGTEYAARHRYYVPRVGDEVKLDDDVVYKVILVVWIENGEPPHVAIDLEPIAARLQPKKRKR